MNDSVLLDFDNEIQSTSFENISSASSEKEDDDDVDDEEEENENSEDFPALDIASTLTKGNDETPSNRRRNIRKILEKEKLSSATLDAQQQERERLQRVAVDNYSFPNYGQLTPADAAEVARKNRIWDERRLLERQKRPTGDVVTLSSDEDADEETRLQSKRRKQSFQVDDDNGSDDSDVVCLDSDSEEQTSTSNGKPKETESAHTNDLMNVADSTGRMLVNVGHPPTDEDAFVPTHLSKIIKPHQLGGIRFLYDNIVESSERFSKSSGFGCILAHSMGLGKTLQVVTFVDVFYRHSPGKRILILVPINTLQNWLHEFEHWLPKVSDSPDVQPRQFDVFILGDKSKTPQSRCEIINEWYKSTGVLLMGYEMFRLLSNKEINSKKSCDKNLPKNGDNQRLQRSQDIYRALIDPGPDLIVCDEGHRIKNMQTNIAKSLSSIKTKRRVVLTGYPLQNNMIEYWCMVNFVRPNYLGNKHEFSNMFERPIKNGQCVDSTPEDVRIMRFRVHVLTNLLKGFVQRRSHSLLACELPPKREYILFLRKSPIQHQLYRRFVVHCRGEVVERIGSWNALKAFAVCCKIWNHPDILQKVLKNRCSLIDNDLDLGEITSSAGSAASFAQNGDSNSQQRIIEGPVSFQPKTRRDENVDYGWAEDIMINYEEGRLDNGFKLLLSMAIIEQSVLIGDKILLFSQSLFTLDLIEEYLSTRYVPCSVEFWKKNRSYFRLDGSTSSSEREKLISRFNNEKSTHLFLISTRAGGLGINLVSANRVIVFDASWNPCHDAQAVCRVYRYGQQKETFIYRLVMDTSMERTIFNRQIGKQGMSERIVDEKPVDAQVSRNDLYNLLKYDEDADVSSLTLNLAALKLEDDLLTDICHVYQNCLTAEPVKHESLLLDRTDQTLSEMEKREARRNYEREKRAMNSVGTEGTRKTYAQVAKEFRLYGDRIFSKSFNESISTNRPLKYTPMPMNLLPVGQNGCFPQSTGVYDDFTNHLISRPPAINSANLLQSYSGVQKIVSPCTIQMPSAQVPGTSGLVVVKEPIDVIHRHGGVFVRSSNGHVLDARGTIFDTDHSWRNFQSKATGNGMPVNHMASGAHENGNTEKQEVILLSDDEV